MSKSNKKNIADWKGSLAEQFNQKIGKNMGVIFGSTMTSQLQRDRADYVYSGDFVRYSSLELIAQEIKQNAVKGNVAEVGVFRGEFAKCINTAFPDRKLYLFDTFEGFDHKDVKVETKNKFTRKMDDFSNTSIEVVLGKMKYRDKVIIKKGYFPDTAEDVDDTFAFVSIDTDLHDPIYNGLKFFYPRLTKGGYIFIHDFNNNNYSGARVAVKKYCKEKNIPYFPLSDAAGSAVIVK